MISSVGHNKEKNRRRECIGESLKRQFVLKMSFEESFKKQMIDISLKLSWE